METLQKYTTANIYGLILFGLGVVICWVIGIRRFNRRGVGGLQHYNSYAQALITITIERIVKLMGIAAIIIGAILFIFDSPKQKEQPNKKEINHQLKQGTNGN